MPPENIPSETEQATPDYEGPVQLTDKDIEVAEGDMFDNVSYVDNLPSFDEPSGKPEGPESSREPIEPVDDDYDPEPTDSGGSDDNSGIDYEFAASYGLSEEEADELGSQAAVEAFARVAAKQMLEVGRKASSKSTPPEEKPETKPEPETKQETKSDSKVDDKPLGIDLSDYDPEEYDDLTNKLVEAVRAMAPIVEQVKSQGSQQSQQEQHRQFIEVQSTIDKLDPEFFGTGIKDGVATKLADDLVQRRDKLVETAAAIERGFIESGKNPPSAETLLRQAMNIEFSEQIAKSNSEERKQRLTKQSARRRPAGSRSTAQRKTYEDEAAMLADDPTIAEFWDSHSSEL